MHENRERGNTVRYCVKLTTALSLSLMSPATADAQMAFASGRTAGTNVIGLKGGAAAWLPALSADDNSSWRLSAPIVSYPCTLWVTGANMCALSNKSAVENPSNRPHGLGFWTGSKQPFCSYAAANQPPR